MVTYYGIDISAEERSVLVAIEQQLREPIPNVDDIDEYTFGFSAKNGHVTGLGLYQKHVISISESIGYLQSLEWLHLRINEIAVLPATIGNLKSLVSLDLWGNRLTSLPDTIGNLRSLKNLELSLNQLKFLPDTIGDLYSLEVLCLHDNQLSLLPASIGSLQSLKKLDISTNYWIKTLPSSIMNLESLVDLIYGGTNVRGILSKTPWKIINWIESRGLI